MITDKKKILNTNISTGNYPDFIETFIKYAAEKKSRYVCVSNVHMITSAFFNQELNEVINDADLATPDGNPLARAMKYIYGLEQDRVAGMDLIFDLMREAGNNKLKVFFLGSTEEVLTKIKHESEIKFPQTKIVGTYSPPFRNLTFAEENHITSTINSTGAHIVFVGLGCPKQEFFMARQKDKINALMLGVGGAFPVLAGTQKRAPKFMQKHSLEWLYRLFQEPRRLFKRYLITNNLFLFLIFGQYIRKKLSRQ